MHEKIMDIQNTIWKIYKDQLKNHDLHESERRLGELTSKYKADKQVCVFCNHLVITWASLLVTLHQTYKEENA